MMNNYEILEVSQNASQEVIKAAYKSLMQRYHPDKNPGNIAVAEHASRIIQAYDVISDVTKRAAYDKVLGLQSSEIMPVKNGTAKTTHTPSGRTVPKNNTSYWFSWLIIASILMSGWLILAHFKKNKLSQLLAADITRSVDSRQASPDKVTVDSGLKELAASSSANADALKSNQTKSAGEATSRTVPAYVSNLYVDLKSGSIHRVLFIPTLDAKVGTFDSEKVLKYIEYNKDMLSKKIVENLAFAKYEELIKLDGELYLRKLVLDAIDEAAGTDRFKEFPSANEELPGHYGVIDVFLPDSFSVR